MRSVKRNQGWKTAGGKAKGWEEMDFPSADQKKQMNTIWQLTFQSLWPLEGVGDKVKACLRQGVVLQKGGGFCVISSPTWLCRKLLSAQEGPSDTISMSRGVLIRPLTDVAMANRLHLAIINESKEQIRIANFVCV
jgi:hypothetical protein